MFLVVTWALIWVLILLVIVLVIWDMVSRYSEG